MDRPDIRPVPCPLCGATNIGVKDMTIATPWRGEARKVWAYCRICSFKGAETVCDVKSSDEEEVTQAYLAWNKDKKQA